MLSFVDYRIDEEPKYTSASAKRDNIRSAAESKARLKNEETEESRKRNLYGRLPVMTDSGTFIINGAERVIVSQLVRSPVCIMVLITIKQVKNF